MWLPLASAVKYLGVSDEIGVQLKRADVPTRCTEFRIEFVWKAVTFERMHAALKSFAVDGSAVSSYIYHRILGHEVEEQTLAKVQLPKK